MTKSSAIRDEWVGRLPAEKPDELTSREWRFLIAHVRDGATYRQLAEDAGISYPRARQIMMKAVAWLEPTRKNRLRVGMHGPVDQSRNCRRAALKAHESTH